MTRGEELFARIRETTGGTPTDSPDTALPTRPAPSLAAAIPANFPPIAPPTPPVTAPIVPLIAPVRTDDTTGQWTEAAKLKTGDELRSPDGETSQTVAAVKIWTGLKWMQDLTVNDTHTYYVMAGATPVLVHNVNYPGACKLPPIKGKTQAQTPNHDTLSGWAGNPEGYTRVSPEKVLNQTDEMNGPITPAGFRDHGVDGQYYASHAERQAAVAEPDTPIGVDRPMCDDCIDWFKQYAVHRGTEQRVTDPTGVNVFRPDGTWSVEPQ